MQKAEKIQNQFEIVNSQIDKLINYYSFNHFQRKVDYV